MNGSTATSARYWATIGNAEMPDGRVANDNRSGGEAHDDQNADDLQREFRDRQLAAFGLQDVGTSSTESLLISIRDGDF